VLPTTDRQSGSNSREGKDFLLTFEVFESLYGSQDCTCCGLAELWQVCFPKCRKALGIFFMNDGTLFHLSAPLAKKDDDEWEVRLSGMMRYKVRVDRAGRYHHSKIYTDGSKKDEKVGYAVVLSDSTTRRRQYPQNSIYSAELISHNKRFLLYQELDIPEPPILQ
jgi:hypothetical protein